MLSQASVASTLASHLLQASLQVINRKYAADMTGVLDSDFQREYLPCLEAGIRAFVQQLERRLSPTEPTRAALSQYLQSAPVAEEISHLLEPGAEIFDQERLLQLARQSPLLNPSLDSTGQSIAEAWRAFLQAFMKVAKTKSEMRQLFAITQDPEGLKDALELQNTAEKMNDLVDKIIEQQRSLRQEMQEFGEFLKAKAESAKQLAESLKRPESN